MTTAKRPAVRCAIYTRKSSDEGLEQEFNSLDAQREACEAYIKSQAHQGWRALPDRFDDGGQSGGTTDRPALQRLLDQVRAKRVEIIVIYKIDRLTRSLADFARLAELFDAHSVSFVSVTQAFNTTTSMGRLMLNVLLSFAQFEREITGERIRDKIAASKKKGLWMGGNVPLGYDVVDRSLVISLAEAETVRTLFRLYLENGNVRAVTAEAERLGLLTKIHLGPQGQRSGGIPFGRGRLYHLLKNPVYIGRIVHKDRTYPGTHYPIIAPETWAAVQQRLAGNLKGERTPTNADSPSLLVGLLVDAEGHRFTPSHAVKTGRRYRYYVDRRLVNGDQPPRSTIRRIPAGEIEGVVRDGIADLLATPNRLIEALGAELNAAETDRAIQAARRLHKHLLESTPPMWGTHLRPILRRVVLDEGLVRVRISRAGLRSVLGLAIARENPAAEPEEELGDSYDLEIAARIATRGVRLKLVIGNDGGRARREQDIALIKTLALAHDWFHRLRTGQAPSVHDIAKAEGVDRSYVSRVLRLAFLAPDIVEAMVDGRHPVELTAKRLLLREDLPLDWREQRRRLGFIPDRA